MRKLTFIELFGVPGGMSLGFKLAGMKPVGALDIYEPGIETYRKNFPDVREENVVCEDASSSNVVEKFQKITSLKKGDINIIIGGPPCQGFSTMGRIKMASLVKNGQRNGNSDARFINDKRNHLYKSFIRFVGKFKPKAIVMENVLGMVSYKNGSVVKQIKEDFEKIGYPNVDSKVLNALDYGVPQSRKRIFFVATKTNKPITWPKETHFGKIGRKQTSQKVKYQTTVWDAIGDLPILKLPEKNSKVRHSEKKYKRDPACEYQKMMRGENDTVENNVTRWHREKDIEVFRNMSPGSRWCELSNADRKKIGYSDDSFEDKWKRLPINSHSWTVTSHLHKDGYMYIHPRQNRTISVREAARLQSFPDSFVFYGSRSAQFKLIGNAVPPLLSMAVAKHVKKLIV
ncbi:DNA -methyltransferase 1 protein [Marine Group I thaumarchaeote SCGC AAA799-E16]|uniref:DNA (cytosine-5-)-methyltransferase n=2 Tax=Marine Group I TaxID=905826 RepID=A0A087RVX2_9ARCH|nr:DNA -methyltransferase 1 protein [Marine Group I thaumarchaeote SCGC AAA799-E16]KFM17626.1 Modification methylase HphIA protein [Marine Group I thaumarchaeote SCGC RSA3]